MRASARRSRIDSRAWPIRPDCSERRPPWAVRWWLNGGRGREVSRLDQRDRQSACRRVERGREAMNAAADDEHVVGGLSQGIEVAGPHGETI
jgi:hypothetical protein